MSWDLTALRFHYTAKHGSWLNIAECELSVLARQGPNHTDEIGGYDQPVTLIEAGKLCLRAVQTWGSNQCHPVQGSNYTLFMVDRLTTEEVHIATAGAETLQN